VWLRRRQTWLTEVSFQVPRCDWPVNARVSCFAKWLLCKKAIALSANWPGVNYRGEWVPIREKRETEKAGKRAVSSCSVVLLKSLVQSVPQTVAVLRIVAERAAVTAGLVLAELAALVSTPAMP
jgi:hypothetical protein